MVLSLEPFYGGRGWSGKSGFSRVSLGGYVGGAEVCLAGATAGGESWLQWFDKVNRLTTEASLRARSAA